MLNKKGDNSNLAIASIVGVVAIVALLVLFNNGGITGNAPAKGNTVANLATSSSDNAKLNIVPEDKTQIACNQTFSVKIFTQQKINNVVVTPVNKTGETLGPSTTFKSISPLWKEAELSLYNEPQEQFNVRVKAEKTGENPQNTEEITKELTVTSKCGSSSGGQGVSKISFTKEVVDTTGEPVENVGVQLQKLGVPTEKIYKTTNSEGQVKYEEKWPWTVYRAETDDSRTEKTLNRCRLQREGQERERRNSGPNIIQLTPEDNEETITTQCSVCGNNKAEPGEACDGTDLNGKTCSDLGYDSGTLECSSDCRRYDTSQCERSGAEELVELSGDQINQLEEAITAADEEGLAEIEERLYEVYEGAESIDEMIREGYYREALDQQEGVWNEIRELKEQATEENEETYAALDDSDRIAEDLMIALDEKTE